MLTKCGKAESLKLGSKVSALLNASSSSVMPFYFCISLCSFHFKLLLGQLGLLPMVYVTYTRLSIDAAPLLITHYVYI